MARGQVLANCVNSITRYESQPTYLCDRLLAPYIKRCLKDSEWSLAERAIELLLEHYQVDYGNQIDTSKALEVSD